jgi:L-fuculose-phosphate aldolase
MVNEYELKRLIVDLGKRIWTRGFVAANDGNITVKLNENELLTTPTGVSKGFMTEDMIIKCDREGRVIQGGNGKYRPSSEVKMHLDVYNERPDVQAVVHAHPPYATSFAVAGIPLDKCVLPEAIIVIGSVPIAPYGLPSTMEIPERMRPYIKENDVVLLENHGAISVGGDLLSAYHKMETLELTASIVWKSIQLGNVNSMPDEERDRLLSIRANYGIKGPIRTCDTKPMINSDNRIETQQFQGVGEYGKSAGSCSCSTNKKETSVSENDIRDIVQKVLAKL